MTGTAPAELISVMAAAHRAFEPRTSDEGRRPRSIRAAILSTPSKAPLTTTSRRTRGPSSFHLFLATRTPCAVISPAASGPARDPARDPLADGSVASRCVELLQAELDCIRWPGVSADFGPGGVS